MKKICAQCTYLICTSKIKGLCKLQFYRFLVKDFEVARATINVRGQGHKSSISIGAFFKRNLLTYLLRLLLLECT